MTKPTEGAKESSQRRYWWSKYWFYTVLISLAVIGVPSAFFVPPIIPGLTNDGNTVVSVRQGILAVLAGALTMLTLSETHRKNTHEKDKNDRDHTRQVYAERRSRYTAAVEQLANEKAAVRLGGIYTLVGLVDEWLADDTLNSEEQQKEGQVIINNLCSYIRSPFPPAERLEEHEARKELEEIEADDLENFSTEKAQRYRVLLKRFEDSAEYQEPENLAADQTLFREEQDVRRTIFSEMSKRSSTFSEDKKSSIPGLWSNFDFDFSRAPVFYSLEKLTIEKANFQSARFYNGTDFSWVTFVQPANFYLVAFVTGVGFINTNFIQEAHFIGADFQQGVGFAGASFAQDAYFVTASFKQEVYFSGVTFAQNAYFIGADFRPDVDFSGVTFTQNANFAGARFAQNADFSKASFMQGMNFNEVIFKKYEPSFTRENSKAQFSVYSDSQNYKFSVGEGSKLIKPGTATLLGKPFEIPVGTVLFDPNSWDEENKKYTRVSGPAKPLDKSNDSEEDKPE